MAPVHLGAGRFVEVPAMWPPAPGHEMSAAGAAALVFAASRHSWHFHLRLRPFVEVFHIPPLAFWFIRQLVQNLCPVIDVAAFLARQ